MEGCYHFPQRNIAGCYYHFGQGPVEGCYYHFGQGSLESIIVALGRDQWRGVITFHSDTWSAVVITLDRDQWRAVLNKTINLRTPSNYLTCEFVDIHDGVHEHPFFKTSCRERG
jgi:hypothetical protein